MTNERSISFLTSGEIVPDPWIEEANWVVVQCEGDIACVQVHVYEI